MAVTTCEWCGEEITQSTLEPYWVHKRSGATPCRTRYATPALGPEGNDE